MGRTVQRTESAGKRCLEQREVDMLNEKQEVIVVAIEGKLNLQKAAPEEFQRQIFQELNELGEASERVSRADTESLNIVKGIMLKCTDIQGGKGPEFTEQNLTPRLKRRPKQQDLPNSKTVRGLT